MSKLFLHIPHSSRLIPKEYLSEFVLSEDELSEELLKMTDSYTDELFPQKYERIVFPVSRLVCDPERFRDDKKEEMSKRGMGAVYTHGSSGQLLRVVRNREAILRRFYDAHHEKFCSAVKRIVEEFGACLIVDCHSFSNIPLPYETEQNEIRPDICVGTDGYHTPERLIDFSKEFFNGRGYSVEINTPYAGSVVPIEYFKKDKRVASIMIEINRSLYMDKEGNRNENFKKIQADLLNLCVSLENQF